MFAPAEDPGVRPAAAGDHPVRLSAPLLPGEILTLSLNLELFRLKPCGGRDACYGCVCVCVFRGTLLIFRHHFHDLINDQ